MTRLCDIDFLDLYPGRDTNGREFSDIKELSSVSPGFIPASVDLADEVGAVRDQCRH